MKKSNYTIKGFDLTKGMHSEPGRVYDQGMIPRRLSNLYYKLGGPLVSRGEVSAYSGVFDSILDGTTRDGAFRSSSTVTNVTTDGQRVYGVTSVDRYKSELTDSGYPQESYVCELVNPSNPYWITTTAPAPKAATPITSVGPASYSTMGDNGAGGFMVNRQVSASALVYDIQGESSRQSPSALSENSIISVYSFYLTRCIGNGYFIGLAGASNVVLCRGTGPGFRFWKLQSTGGTAVDLGASVAIASFDALYVDGSVYLVYKAGTDNVNIKRWSAPSDATGSQTSTPTNLPADNESTYAIAWGAGSGRSLDAVCISGQTSPTELRVALSGRDSAGTAGYVAYLRRNLTTTASVAAYASAATLAYTRALTCNGNVILADKSSSSDEFTTSTVGYEYSGANNSRVYGYRFDGVSALTESVLTGFTLAASTASVNELYRVDRRIYTHISSEGLVCIGGNIYRAAETAATITGTAQITLTFLCKAIDLYPSMAANGVLSTQAASSPSRKYNSLSRWVSERYVAIPCGSSARAKSITDSTTISPNEANFTGSYENDSLVLMDIQPMKLTCIQERNAVSCFGHGYSIGPDRTCLPSFFPDRPYISAAMDSTTKSRVADWQTNAVLSYRLVVTESVGGIESYCASATTTINVGSDTTKDVIVSVYVNNLLPYHRLYLYRNDSTRDAAGDFYLITSEDYRSFSSETDQTWDIRDGRLTYTIAQQRPLDPTGGGTALQGLFVAGMRDIVATADRNYVVTSDSVYPCQSLIGDDRMPTPLPDAVIQIPPLYGSGRFLGSVSDSLVVATDTAIIAIAGDPPNMLGQGGNQRPFLMLSGGGGVAKPCLTPHGLFIPRSSGIILVDVSRQTTEVARQIMGSATGGLLGDCSYSEKIGQLVVMGAAVPDAWGSTYNGDAGFMLDAGGQRWTGIYADVDNTLGVACPNRGQWAGGIYFGFSNTTTKLGYIPASPSEFANVLIDTGWNSYDGRFVETNARRVLVDGYVGIGAESYAADATVTTMYNLRTEDADYKVNTVSAKDFTDERDGTGWRWTISPVVYRGSSHRHFIYLEPDQHAEIEIGTVAVETQSDMTKYTSANETGE